MAVGIVNAPKNPTSTNAFTHSRMAPLLSFRSLIEAFKQHSGSTALRAGRVGAGVEPVAARRNGGIGLDEPAAHLTDRHERRALTVHHASEVHVIVHGPSLRTCANGALSASRMASCDSSTAFQLTGGPPRTATAHASTAPIRRRPAARSEIG